MSRKRNRRAGRQFVPVIEALEDRCTPAAVGAPWPDGRHLTVSFAPDGTDIAGRPSDLFQALNAQMALSDWQREILRGLQTWAVQANISIGVVADGGQPLGATGPAQHDERFGDIRIAAHAMAPDALSVSVPHDPFLSGTWDGDLLFNSAAALTADNLFAVALHEASHVLGLEHSADPNSPRFSHLNDRTELTPEDVADIQALYGLRLPDAHEGLLGNNSMATAPRIRFGEHSGDDHGATPLLVFGEVADVTDVDYFRLRPLDGYRGPVTFRLQTAGISLLAPRLTILNAQGNVLGQSLSTNPLGDTVTVRLNAIDPKGTYYVRVDGAVGDVFGIGRYGLAITADARLTTSPTAIDAVMRGPYDTLRPDDIGLVFTVPEGVLFQDDDDDPDEEERPQTPPGYAPNSHYAVLASLSDAADVDTYRIRTPEFPQGRPGVMTVILSPTGPNGVTPRVSVFDRDLNPYPSEVLLNGNGTYTVQATGVKSDANFYLRVFAPAETSLVGNYSLEVSFGRPAADLTPLATGALGDSQTQQDYALYVAQSQLFQFRLSARTTEIPAQGSVRMSVLTADGSEIFALVAPAGETVTGSAIFLAPGTYRVQFRAEGTLPPALSYSLAGFGFGEPIGPRLSDPTLEPQFVSPTDPDLFSYPGGVESSVSFFFALLADLGVVDGGESPPDPGTGEDEETPPSEELPPEAPPDEPDEVDGGESPEDPDSVEDTPPSEELPPVTPDEADE